MERLEQSPQVVNLKEKQKELLRIIQRELAHTYPKINALENYMGFREFELYSFISRGNTSDDYNIFLNHCHDSHRGQVIWDIFPIYATYMAIAKKGEYRKRISKQLVTKGVIESPDILGGWRTPASVVAIGVARETILLGLDNDSLVIDLNIFSPELKSLDECY